LLELKLFGDYNNYISIIILLETQRLYSCSAGSGKNLLFGGLHCASIFGVVEIVAGLAEVEGCDINQEDCTGNTPPMWSACSAHERVVKTPLGRNEVNPNKPDKDGQTLFCRAAWNGHGHEGVVKALLGRDDVSPNKRGGLCQTPLSWTPWTPWGGQQGVVKTLLEQGLS